jgi:molybdopterin-binding protein
MNFFIAKVKKIEKVEELTLVTFIIKNQLLQMIALEISARLKVDSIVTLEVKSSSVILATLSNNLKSSANQLICSIINITYGELLCVIEVEIDGFKIESIVLTQSIKKINIQKKDTVLTLINPTELSIGKIDD